MRSGWSKSPYRCAGKRHGVPCPNQATRSIATVYLCARHVDEMVAELGIEAQPEKIVTVYKNSPAVVYYISDPSVHHTKIGTTTRLAQRFVAIRGRRPTVRLLAAEPGHYELERARHAQWAHLRVDQPAQREWYQTTDALVEFINALRQRHGVPVLSGQ